MIPIKLNADYEVELFFKQKAPVAINHSIEFLHFFLNSAPLYTDKKYSESYLSYIERITGHRPVTVSSGAFENGWGLLKNRELEQWWNSKITTTELIINSGWCGHTHILNKSDDFKKVTWPGKYLIKDPFGMSGQKFQIVEQEADISKAFGQGPKIIEPFFQRVYDFSVYVFPGGKEIAYQNLVDEKFQYKGTLFSDHTYPTIENLSFYSEIDQSEWQQFKERIQKVITFFGQQKNECGYSIDAFVYRENGKLKIRALSEINYRKTMGRLAFELSQKFNKNQTWSAMLMCKSFEHSEPIWDKINSSNVVVLSPGDSRFEMFLLSATSEELGKEAFSKLRMLLPNAQFAINL